MADTKMNERDNKDAQESGRPVQLDKDKDQQGGRSGQQQGMWVHQVSSSAGAACPLKLQRGTLGVAGVPRGAVGSAYGCAA